MATDSIRRPVAALPALLRGESLPEIPLRPIVEDMELRAKAVLRHALKMLSDMRAVVQSLIGSYASKGQLVAVESLKDELKAIEEAGCRWQHYCSGPFQARMIAHFEQKGIGLDVPVLTDEEIEASARRLFEDIDLNDVYCLANEKALNGIRDIPLANPARMIDRALRPEAPQSDRGEFDAFSPAIQLRGQRQEFMSHRDLLRFLEEHPDITHRHKGRHLYIHAAKWNAFWAEHDRKTSESLKQGPELEVAFIEQASRRQAEIRAKKME
jgi:hypothetical protein